MARKTELELEGEKYRQQHIVRNFYDDNKSYNSNHKNALSDGDDKGKGENNGQIGSLTDITTRNENLARNFYLPNDQYSSNHKNALSDNDDRGKGELNGEVGSKTDKILRTDNVVKNKYGEKNKYPDFI